MIASLKAQNHEPDPPAWAAAAAIATSPQRRPRLPQKLPSDILTLQSKGHLNLVATTPNSRGVFRPGLDRLKDGGSEVVIYFSSKYVLAFFKSRTRPAGALPVRIRG